VEKRQMPPQKPGSRAKRQNPEEKIGRHQVKFGKLFFRTDSLTIFKDDFLKTRCIDKESVDLIVTSPPYNVDIKYNSHNDEMPYTDYLKFTKDWLAKAYKLAKSDGRLCLNIPLDKNKGGQQSVYADVTSLAKKVGWKYHTTIIWNEQNISRRTAWGSWLSASAPFVIAPVEVILVLYKGAQWKKTSGSGKSDTTREEFLEWTNGVWNFSGESKRRIGHPAPFPVELPRRCIKLFSFVGDTVLDPFVGSGTTLVACSETGRKGVGVEIDVNYCKLARRRLIREANAGQMTLPSRKPQASSAKANKAGPRPVEEQPEKETKMDQTTLESIEFHV
jgi:site-specific DNA-methyltransferase (adenine-specific)